LRRVLRLRTGETPAFHRRRLRLRLDPSGNILLVLSIIPGTTVAGARDLRDPVDNDHADGDADIQHRTQPIVRVEPDVQRRRRSQEFHATTKQPGAIRVH